MEKVNVLSFTGVITFVFGLWIGYILILAVRCMKKYLGEGG